MSGPYSTNLWIDNVPCHVLNVRRSRQSSYVPLVRGQEAGAQLQPVTWITWHRGSGAARKVLPGMHDHTIRGWTLDPGLLMPGPKVTHLALAAQDGEGPAGQGIVEKDGALYVATGRYIGKIVPTLTGATITTEKDFGPTQDVSSLGAFGGKLWAFMGTTANIAEQTGVGVWDQALTGALGPVQRGLQARVFWSVNSGGSVVTAERIIGTNGTNGIQYAQATLHDSAAWTPNPNPIKIEGTITGLVASYNHVYIGTTEGIRDLDASGIAPNITPEMEDFVLPTNGIAMLAADGFIYSNAGYGIIRVQVRGDQAGIPQWVTPMHGLPSEAPYSGVYTALVRFGRYIIAAQWDQSKNVAALSFGRESIEGELGQMVWHSYPIVLEGYKVTSLHVSGAVAENPRLWMALVNGAGVASVAWAPLPLDTPYQDLRHNRPYRFTTQFEAVMSEESYGEDAVSQVLMDLTAEGENLGSGAYFDVQIAVASGAHQQIGSLNNNPTARLIPSSPIVGPRHHIHLLGYGSEQVPPILRKLTSRTVPRPDVLEVRTYQLYAGPASRTQGGPPMADDVDRLLAAIPTWITGSQVTVIDETGAVFSAMVLASPAPAWEIVEEHPNTARFLYVVTLHLAVLTTPAVPFSWDDGTTYDSTGGWS